MEVLGAEEESGGAFGRSMDVGSKIYYLLSVGRENGGKMLEEERVGEAVVRVLETVFRSGEFSERMVVRACERDKDNSEAAAAEAVVKIDEDEDDELGEIYDPERSQTSFSYSASSIRAWDGFVDELVSNFTSSMGGNLAMAKCVRYCLGVRLPPSVTVSAWGRLKGYWDNIDGGVGATKEEFVREVERGVKDNGTRTPSGILDSCARILGGSDLKLERNRNGNGGEWCYAVCLGLLGRDLVRARRAVGAGGRMAEAKLSGCENRVRGLGGGGVGKSLIRLVEKIWESGGEGERERGLAELVMVEMNEKSEV